MVLEGYVRRNPKEPWDQNDVVLLSALKRVADQKYMPGWLWIIEELALGKQVTEVLKAVGPRWKDYEARQCLFQSLICSLTSLDVHREEGQEGGACACS